MMFAQMRKIIRELKQRSIFQLVKHSVIYGIGNIIQRFLTILLLPIYTRYLTPTDYGIVAMLGIFSMIVGTITMCGLTNGIGRYFYYTKQERTSLSDVVWSPVLFVGGFSVFVLTVLSLFSGFLSNILFDSENYSYLVKLTLVGVFVSNLSGLGRSVLVFEEKSKTVNYINICGVVVGVVCGLLLVVWLGRGVTGAVEAGLVGSTIMSVPIILLSVARFEPAFSRSMLTKQLRFSLPLVGAAFAFWFIDSSDRFLLKMFLPLSEVGLYNIGYNIGMIMMIFVGGFTLAWPPYYHKNNQGDQGQTVCNGVLKLYLVVSCVFVVLISLSGPLVVKVLTTEGFYGAYTVVPWVAMAYMLKGPYLIFLMGVLVRDRSSWQLYLEIFAAMANIGLNVLLIPVIGREAAAITTLVSYSVMVLGAYFMVMRVNPIPGISVRYIGAILILTVVFSVVPLWAGDRGFYLALSSTAFAFFAGVFLLVGYREFAAQTKRKARGF